MQPSEGSASAATRRSRGGRIPDHFGSLDATIAVDGFEIAYSHAGFSAGCARVPASGGRHGKVTGGGTT
jgi:hypothetical protein